MVFHELGDLFGYMEIAWNELEFCNLLLLQKHVRVFYSIWIQFSEIYSFLIFISLFLAFEYEKP